jgi:hypothetical protein
MKETSMTHIRNLDEAEQAAVDQAENDRQENIVRHFETVPKVSNASAQIDRLIAGFEQRIRLLQSLKNSL